MNASLSVSLLDVWESVKEAAPAKRNAALLAATHPERTEKYFSQMSIGRSDATLTNLYQQLFGEQVEGVSRCGKCKQALEFGFSLNEIPLSLETEPADLLTIEQRGYIVQFRLPRASDIEAASACENSEMAEHLLLRQCVLHAEYEKQKIALNEVPSELLLAVDQAMANAEPQTETSLAITCAVCQHRTEIFFDITCFLWHALDGWASQTLHEVHRLALAYGWSETEILSMAPRRRQHYLSLVEV